MKTDSVVRTCYANRMPVFSYVATVCHICDSEIDGKTALTVSLVLKK